MKIKRSTYTHNQGYSVFFFNKDNDLVGGTEKHENRDKAIRRCKEAMEENSEIVMSHIILNKVWAVTR